VPRNRADDTHDAVGNEADQYAGGSRPVGWASSDYTAQFLVRPLPYPVPQISLTGTLQGWTSVLSRNLSLPPHIFQAGGFANDPTPSAPMTTADIVAEGVDTTGAVEVFAQHAYQYSTCDPTRNALATLPHLVNHQNITVCADDIGRRTP
jgi:hypothetical protein